MCVLEKIKAETEALSLVSSGNSPKSIHDFCAFLPLAPGLEQDSVCLVFEQQISLLGLTSRLLMLLTFIATSPAITNLDPWPSNHLVKGIYVRIGLGRPLPLNSSMQRPAREVMQKACIARDLRYL